MKIIKHTPAYLPALNPLFDEWFDRAFGGLDVLPKNTLPAVNIREKDTEYTLDVAVPGLNREDINIELDGHVLSISSENKSEKNEKDDKGRWARREFHYQSFKRTFTLPEDGVDTEKIEAKHENGVLTIVLPKKLVEAVETKKRIDIR